MICLSFRIFDYLMSAGFWTHNNNKQRWLEDRGSPKAESIEYGHLLCVFSWVGAYWEGVSFGFKSSVHGAWIARVQFQFDFDGNSECSPELFVCFNENTVVFMLHFAAVIVIICSSSACHIPEQINVLSPNKMSKVQKTIAINCLGLCCFRHINKSRLIWTEKISTFDRLIVSLKNHLISHSSLSPPHCLFSCLDE